MDASCQPAKRLDTVFLFAPDHPCDLEPGLDWLVVFGAFGRGTCLDLDEPARLSTSCFHG